MSQTDNTWLGSKISNALESNSFAAFFMNLKLRSESKQDYMDMGESYEIMCSLEGV